MTASTDTASFASVYDANALRRFGADLLQRAGLAAPMATCVADTLVEGDLLGHDTHGLA
ncbi:MAG: Ldh family oxidoreductase, partial [Variovorax sp.]